ncbi:response regulator receiver modulated CheW protein [Solidesulfovibrio carbinoliphilus subsp. oakridgensis]|uniref:Response regulator receiver modulated CheW protein n=1 Tax=Solidesulfovibrio carbinoliphilus subsp. oakridgensis TaxID=694327 RepID=G7Q6U4_9BACT|nr:chemotaxis protein [Solidesulfovibrio carbinoliphilus]EHJ48029.1 response regulator receiver modulated CheW protein [Solidesulfovibrio carbinoliphilus subsp. oakridgensis]
MAQTNILLETGTNELEIIEFYIDEATEPGVKPYRAHYGVNVAKVLEIIRLPKVTGMPQTPHPCVIGTFNLRSRVIPLIDLSMWLGKPMARDENTKVIVSEFNKVINAFMVSGVTRIHRLSWSEVEPPSGFVASFAANNFTGVVKFPDHIVLLLDMEQIIWDLNPALAMRTEREHAAAIPAPDRSAYKTLVVDDSNSIRRLIASYLEKDGFEVLQDINGQNAWDRLQAWKGEAARGERPLAENVNLVVTDIEMPSMDGHTLCKNIKDDPILKSLPVVLFSSLINDQLYHKGLSVGADDQVTKPEVGTLAERARKLIEDHR